MAHKVIAVFGPDNRYLSHCTEKRATSLLNSQRATRVNATTIKLMYTKKGWTNVKHELIKKSQRICYICNEAIPEDEIATIDHIVPSCRSTQANTYSNLRCCCERCNHDKDSRKLSEYVRYIQKNRDKYDYISDKRLIQLELFAFEYERDFYLKADSIIHINKPDHKTNTKKRMRRVVQ